MILPSFQARQQILDVLVKIGFILGHAYFVNARSLVSFQVSEARPQEVLSYQVHQ
jgi:hypothetical protein